MDKKLKFAVFGTGFWSKFQIYAWYELKDVECVALYNRTKEKAEKIAELFGIDKKHVYSDPESLLRNEDIDFVDIITNPETHAVLTELVASFKKPVISQKPMSDDIRSAERMIKVCKRNNVPLFIHENWRWQSPIRRVYQLIKDEVAGKPFRARISYLTSFRVYENQPFLKEAKRFILADIGPHLLDVCRFLFGEMKTLYCNIKNVNPEVKGEDVASVSMKTVDDVIVNCDMSYFSKIEYDRFPETYILVECDKGSIELKPDFYISVTTKEGTKTERVAPKVYPWADPKYAVVHASIVDCNRNILSALKKEGQAETTGEDNIKTMRLVETAYKSSNKGKIIKFNK